MPFQFFAERYDRGSLLVTTNLAFTRWTEVLGGERMTAALLDRLTHRGHVLLVEGESYRLRESLRRQGGHAVIPSSGCSGARERARAREGGVG